MAILHETGGRWRAFGRWAASPARPWIMAVAIGLVSAPVQAASLRAVGVLGNSGSDGPGLVRVGPFDPEHAASGVALDPDWTVYASGGDRINRLSLDGHLIQSFPLKPAGWTVDSRAFARLGRTLYFLARSARGEEALFGLALGTDAAARATAVKLPARKRPWLWPCLAAQPLDGRLLLATEPKDTPEDRIAVCRIDPTAGTVEPMFTIKGLYPGGLAVDSRRRVIYLGAQFGLFVGGQTHQEQYGIMALRPDGKPLSDAFPAACTKTPAVPTQFRGVVSLAAEALWESAWYGFLARLDLQAVADPGRLVEWHHELHYPTQVLEVFEQGRPRDPLLIATPQPDALYYAVWDRSAGRLELVRRLGALPVIAGLGLSPDGWVTVSTARAQLFWRWEDAPDAVPRKAGLHVAVTPIFSHDERFFALAAPYRLEALQKETALAVAFHPRVGGNNEATRFGNPVPMKKPVGLSVQVAADQPQAALFVTDAATKQIWRVGFSRPEMRPVDDRWTAVALEGLTLEDPTDIAALSDGRLLLADAGRLLMLEPRASAYRLAWQFDRWGQADTQRFGQRLRFAAQGDCLVVSDTQRHRLVYLDWQRRQVLAQFGTTDKPGPDLRHLNRPDQVALAGPHVVVADAGNQRLLKLAVEP